jgi:hypothetical protein
MMAYAVHGDFHKSGHDLGDPKRIPSPVFSTIGSQDVNRLNQVLKDSATLQRVERPRDIWIHFSFERHRKDNTG